MTDTDRSDLVLLLDEDARVIGSAPKADVHGTQTPLHLAFSCHVLDMDGRVLVTRRALTKQTWPGVWTNSFCGHPRPGEPPVAAVHRRAEFELGLVLSSVDVVLPSFRYRATDASGIVENEVCPVFVARTEGDADLNPHEVAEAHWVEPRVLAASIAATPWAFSPWLVLQARELPFFGPGRGTA